MNKRNKGLCFQDTVHVYNFTIPDLELIFLLHLHWMNSYLIYSKKLEDLQGARDRDQKYYTEQINKLQQELEKSKKV